MPEVNKMIKDKIQYKDIFYLTEHKNGKLDINVGDYLELGAEIELTGGENLVEIPFEGKLLVTIGEEVTEDTVLSTSGKLKKKSIKAGTSGVVTNIDDKNIYIKTNNDTSTEPKQIVTAMFPGTVVDKTSTSLVVKEKALVINLLLGKGPSQISKLAYLEDPHKFIENPDKDQFKDKIVVVEQIDSETYPIISALGAKGIFAFSTDYAHFQSLITFNAALGIIFGYGDIKITKNLKDLFRNNEGSVVWYDSEYSRLVIPTEKVPDWLNNYSFDITSLISYK
ncbi:MAG: hypothetical protein QG570_60 [Patescibacteria group bacterium]|nr:hypothetical protein [Patescibacteria group bacterium]